MKETNAVSINYNSLTEKNKKDPQETPGLSLVIKRKITLVRHGITEWNKKFRYQGITDVPLAAEGEEQAKRAAMRLSCESVDRVISSPLGRSMKTDSIIAEIIGKNSVETWDELREVDFGEWEALTVPQIKERFGEDLFESGSPHRWM
jgi:alpha-ribazole phosphatase/probable phosphoglycerate mutase